MLTPTNDELALLRSQPQETKMHLSIYSPTIAMQAQVNDASITKGATDITFDNVVTGSWTNVYYSSTCLVGSTPGARDKGTIYILYAADSSSLIVGENDHINWEDDDYITVLNFWEIYPRYPSYTLTGDGVLTVKKVFDVEYTDQNTNLGQFICMGSHYANFMDGDPDGDTATHDIYFTATGTVNVNGDGMTYAWEFTGSTSTGSSLHTPGWITYNNPGHYHARLTVTSSTGEINRGTRCISIYDRFGEGSVNPIQSWGIESFSGSRAESGYRARIWVKEEVEDIVDNALVILFYENWYGGTKQNIHHNAEGRDHVFFVGYVIGGSIEYDYQTSTVYFDVASPTEIMKQGEAFSVSLEDSGDPVASATDLGGSPWFFLDGLTIQTAVWHYLRWHTSIMYAADFQFIGNDHGAFVDKGLHFADFDRTSIYDALASLVESAYFGKVISDRQGKIWVERDTEATTDMGSNVPLNMSLDGDDWMNQPVISERAINEYSYVQLGGLAYTRGVEDAAYLSAAPGETPAYRGSKLIQEGLAVASQAELNNLSGNVYAFRNSRFPEVSIPISGNYSNFDITPKSIVRLYMNHTFRNLNWEGKPFSIEGVTWDYKPDLGILFPTIRVAEATVGVAGDAIPIPPIPPDEGQDQPPTTIQLPPIPEIPPFEIPTIGGGVLSGDYMWIFPTIMDHGGSPTDDWLVHASTGGTKTPWFIFDSGAASTEDVWGGILIPGYVGTVTVIPVGNTRSGSNDAIDTYNDVTILEYPNTYHNDSFGLTSVTYTGGYYAELITDAQLSFTTSGGTMWVYCVFELDHVDMAADFDFYGWLVVFS